MPVQPRFYNWLLLVVLCVGLIALTGLSLFSTGQTSPSSEKIADFSFTDINKQNKNLSDFSEKIVLIHFWASWCLPCEKEFPSLVASVQKNPDLILLAVSVDNDQNDMQHFLKKQKADSQDRIYPIWDQDKKISQSRFGITQYPETLVLNRDQTLYKHVVGTANWTDFRFPSK